MLGDIGGLQQSLYLIGLVLISFLSRRIFVSSILKNIYQVKHFAGKQTPDSNDKK
jgi:hypothetical protein